MTKICIAFCEAPIVKGTPYQCYSRSESEYEKLCRVTLSRFSLERHKSRHNSRKQDEIFRRRKIFGGTSIPVI
jgi:hypothetical protein